MKIQLIIKDVMKSSFLVTYAFGIERRLHQFTFWVIKVNIDQTHEARISKNLETDNRVCRKENGYILMQNKSFYRCFSYIVIRIIVESVSCSAELTGMISITV